MKFKLFCEEQGVQNFTVKLEKLSIDGPTKTIRCKAFLAGCCLNDMALLMEIAKEDYKDANRFFLILGEGLQEKLLADRNE